MFHPPDEPEDWREGGVDKLCLLETAERLFGRDVAMFLQAELGGQSIYVNRKVIKGSRLAALLGDERAAALGEELGGLTLDVPIGTPAKRRERVRILTEQGLTVSQIARQVGITERMVSIHRARLRQDGDLLAREETQVFVERRRNRIRVLSQQGSTVTEIAREIGSAEILVRKFQNGLRRTGELPPDQEPNDLSYSPQRTDK